MKESKVTTIDCAITIEVINIRFVLSFGDIKYAIHFCFSEIFHLRQIPDPKSNSKYFVSYFMRTYCQIRSVRSSYHYVGISMASEFHLLIADCAAFQEL